MMKVYHCGNTLFKEFSLSKRIWNKTTHQASGLGLFFDFKDMDYLRGFGGHIYEITLKENLRIKTWDISEFVDVCKIKDSDWSTFDLIGREISKEYDVIFIQECNGICNQGIILNDSAVENFVVIEAVSNIDK